MSEPGQTRLPAVAKPRLWWLPVAVGAVVLVIVGVVAWSLWPEPTRERQYRQESACLFTGTDGLGEPQVAQLWAGMQNTSADTLVRVQHRVVRGPQTIDGARAVLAGLAAARCDVIVAGGALANQAIRADAALHPEVRFILTEPGDPGGANLQTLAPGPTGGWDEAIQQELTQLAS